LPKLPENRKSAHLPASLSLCMSSKKTGPDLKKAKDISLKAGEKVKSRENQTLLQQTETPGKSRDTKRLGPNLWNIASCE